VHLKPVGTNLYLPLWLKWLLNSTETGSLDISQNLDPVSLADFSNSMIQLELCHNVLENLSGNFGIASVGRQMSGEGVKKAIRFLGLVERGTWIVPSQFVPDEFVDSGRSGRPVLSRHLRFLHIGHGHHSLNISFVQFNLHIPCAFVIGCYSSIN